MYEYRKDYTATAIRENPSLETLLEISIHIDRYFRTVGSTDPSPVVLSSTLRRLDIALEEFIPFNERGDFTDYGRDLSNMTATAKQLRLAIQNHSATDPRIGELAQEFRAQEADSQAWQIPNNWEE